MKKRLLIFHPALAPYRLDLFNSLHVEFDLHLVFTNRNVPYQDYDQTSLLAQLDAPYSFLDTGFKVLGRQVRFGAAKVIAEHRPDVIVTSEFSLLSLQIASGRYAGNPRRVLWTADNPEIVATEKLTRSMMRRLILPRIDGLIVYSAAVKKYYEDHFQQLPPTGISPNAQSEQVFRQKLQDASDRASQLCSEQNLGNCKIMLYVGRLAVEKRLDRLVRVFARLQDQNDDLRLVLVGDGTERAGLEKLADESGVGPRTIFAGHCEGRDLYAWFNLGSVFVLPSEFEPWGAVVNEALIAGLPVICSTQVGASELITEGYNGAVVDADDPRTFAAALSDWLGRVQAHDPGSAIVPKEILLTESFAQAVAGFAAVVSGPK